MKRWIPIIVVLRFWLPMIAASAFPEYPLALPCPSDPSLFGYTSILDLNTELRRHASALAPPLNRIPTEEFRYRLCPQTSLTVNASHSLLLPPELLLHQPIIQCGRKGDSLDRCIIQGGKTQVLLLDDWSNSTQRQSIDFLGISFQGSHNISIAALSTKTTVRFIDCHWKNIQGRSAIMMAKARALAWPQVPQPTFILEDHNIFASRRLESIGLTMDLLCQRCSFQNSGQDDFVLLDSYLPGASLRLEDSIINSISGAMVANMLHGHLQLVHTVVSQCSTTVATIRAQFQSTLELYNTTFQENEEMIATIAVTHESKMQMNFSKLEQNVAVLAPVVVVEGSQAFVADSCWTVSNNSRPAILVDSTSSLVPERTTVSILEPEESTTESPTACGAGIWKLDSSWTCLETQSCNGACQTMTIQDQCQMPSKIPAWGKSVATSSANRMLGGTLLSMVIAGILILV